MKAENKVPAIRFEGFSGDWEEKIFLDIANRVSIQHESKLLPCIEYEDIVAGKGLLNKDIFQKKIFKSGLKFEVGDVLYGKLRPYLKNWLLADFEGIAVGDFWVLRSENVTSEFLFYLIQTSKFEFVSNLSAGSKMPRSDWGLVSNAIFSVPTNTLDSKKIGDYFQKLDRLINQHQQKHQQLSNLKQAMLEKMFPKAGKTTPEIRFQGFNDEWEVKELGEITKIKTGSSNREDSGLDGKYTFFDRSEEIRTSDIYLFDCEAVIVAGEGSDFIPKYFVGKFDLHQRTYAIMQFDNCDGKYIFHYIHLFRKYFLGQAVGSTVKSLRLPMFEKMPIKLPSKKEQTAIGNYFQKLDQLINQHQEQISKLNRIKQACLSKMFV